jgi:hypothetical protein
MKMQVNVASNSRRSGQSSCARRAYYPLSAPCEHRQYLLDGFRTAEKITLHFGAAPFSDFLQLLLRLDALDDRRDLHGGRHFYDRFYDSTAIASIREPSDKEGVNLDLIEWEFSQIAQ